MQPLTLNISSLLPSTDNKRFIPFYKPAVFKGSCEVDREALFIRAGIIMTLSTLTLLGTVYLGKYPRINKVTLPLFAVGSISYEIWVARRVADIRAVDQYLTWIPYPSATKRIQESFYAAQLLVKKQGDLSQLNVNGESLTKNLDNFDIFKLLIDNKARINFCEYVENEDLRYLKYILQEGIVTAANVPEELQVACWLNIGCFHNAIILKHYGFNLNARDRFGCTALHRLVQTQESRCGYYGHIALLLYLGIDPTIKGNVFVRGLIFGDLMERSLTAYEMASSQDVKDLLASFLSRLPEQSDVENKVRGDQSVDHDDAEKPPSTSNETIDEKE